MLTHTVDYPGMREALSHAEQRATLAVLTNKPLLPARGLLTRLRLDRFFALLVGGDGPYPRKPDPQGLRSAAQALGATAVLLVGDSPIDEETAHAAGCAFAYARYGFGAVRFERAPATSYVLDHPSELPSVLDRFLASAVER